MFNLALNLISIPAYFNKIFEKEPSDEMLEESLEILIISEVIKIHEDDRYKSIIKKFLD